MRSTKNSEKTAIDTDKLQSLSDAEIKHRISELKDAIESPANEYAREALKDQLETLRNHIQN